MLTASLVALLLSAAPPPPAKPSVLTQLVHSERDGGLDVSTLPFTQDSIKQVVLSWQPQIQRCYEDHLAVKNKAAEGVLKTSWVITPEGFVKSAKVHRATSTLKDPKLHDCVTAVLSSMEFPKPPNGKPQPIEFPFNLKAQH
jgi:hypothetical protein